MKNSSSDETAMKPILSIIMAFLLMCLAGCAEIATTANVSARAENSADAAITEITIPPIATPAQVYSTAEGGQAEAFALSGGGEPGLTAATPSALPMPSETPELTPSPAPDPTPEYTVEPVDDKKAYLNAGSANLREGPGTEYAILEELLELEPLCVTGKIEEWYRVEAGNETGFVLAEFVEFGTAPTPKPSFSVKSMDDKAAYVNAGSANLREGPGTKYEIVVELSRNEKITVTGTSGDWYRVEYGRKKGFISNEFVEFGAPPTATPRPTATPKPDVTAEATPKPTPTANASNGNSSWETPRDYFSDTSRFTAEELLLIAQVVQEEAKGTSVEARAAVANTIYNRYLSSKYPDTIEGIIFQKNQYTVADDEDEIRSVKPVKKTIEAVTQIFVEGDTFLPEDVLFFRSASRGTSWGDKREYYATYGNNAFFRSFY